MAKGLQELLAYEKDDVAEAGGKEVSSKFNYICHIFTYNSYIYIYIYLILFNTFKDVDISF